MASNKRADKKLHDNFTKAHDFNSQSYKMSQINLKLCTHHRKPVLWHFLPAELCHET